MLKFKLFAWIIAVFLMSFLLFSVESLFLQRSLAEKTLRLHVIANSDSLEDQREKLDLRDYLLSLMEPLLNPCDSLDSMTRVLHRELASLEASANRFMQVRGSEHPIHLTIGHENYSTRYYDSLSMPAGEYFSLQVHIGNAKGKNWWCIVFPNLCEGYSPNTFHDGASTAGYTPQEEALLTEKETKYELRFKVLEWINALIHPS